jgi:flagellar basal-body rod protein FlgG
MLVQQTGYDTTAQNLANASTSGYRRTVAGVETFVRLLDRQMAGPDTPEGLYQPRVPAATSQIDATVGASRATGNTTDLALRGNGYFTLRLPNGGEAYTRSGNFTLDNTNRLVTEDGCLVLGEKGPITIRGAKWDVSRTGEVMVDDVLVDRLKLVSLPDLNSAVALSETRWTTKAAQPATSVEVQQGFLESSNVNPVSELVNMITLMRTYEASQRAVQAMDTTLDKAVNAIAG